MTRRKGNAMRALSSCGMILFVIIAALAILFSANATFAQEATETPLPAVEVTEVVQPPVVVVEAPPSAPAVSYEAVLLFIGSVIAGLFWFANQTNKRVQSSVPLELALTIAEALVKLTPTTTDDELLARLKLLIDTPAAK